MLVGVRDAVRFQGRVRRLPVLYAASLWIAGIIETIGAFVMLFAYSVISRITPDVASQDQVFEELSWSLFGGTIGKQILNALFGPGTLFVVGVIVFVAALHFGRASDEKFEMRQMNSVVEDASATAKKQKLVDIAILVLTIIHMLPTLVLFIVLIPEIFNGGAPAPGDPWYMSRWGSLFAVVIFGFYACVGIGSAIFMLLRKRWAYHFLFYFYVFTVVIMISDGDLVRASGLGKVAFIMPAVALWPLIRHLKVGISIAKSWRGMALLLAVVPVIVQMLILNNVNFGDGVDGSISISMWAINLGAVIYLGIFIFVAYGAINRDPHPGWAELAASLIVAYPIINSLIGVVVQAANIFSTAQS